MPILAAPLRPGSRPIFGALGLDAGLAVLFVVVVSIVTLAGFVPDVGSAAGGHVWSVLYLIAAIRLTSRGGALAIARSRSPGAASSAG